MPIAMIVTDRRRVELVGTDPTERISMSDDHVSSIVGMHRGPTFRQIEVEAGSPGAERLIDDVSNALIEAGAVPTDASKLETVLGETPEPEIVLPGSGAGMSITDAIRFAVGRAPHDSSRTTPRRGSAQTPKRSIKRGSQRVACALTSRRSDRSCIRPPSSA